MSEDFFNPEQEEGTHFELLPSGFYICEMVEAINAPPKNGNGSMLTAVWHVVEGPYTSRQLYQRLCYVHPNEMTQTIARQRLKDICDALDVHEPLNDQNLGLLLHKPARLTVAVKSDKDGLREDWNEVVRVRPLDPKQGPAAAVPKSENGNDKKEPENSTKTSTPPWRKKA